MMSSWQNSSLRKNRKPVFNISISMGTFSIIHFFCLFVVIYRHLSLTCSHNNIPWDMQVCYSESTWSCNLKSVREMPWIFLCQEKWPRDKCNKAPHRNAWFLAHAMRHTYIIQAVNWVNGCKQKVNVQRTEKGCKLQHKGGILYGRI